MEYQTLIRDLTQSPVYYTEWFNSASETQLNMLWDEVWNVAAKSHSENDFVQGLYDFYQLRGYLTYKQWGYLIRTIQPSVFTKSVGKNQSLRDRIK